MLNTGAYCFNADRKWKFLPVGVRRMKAGKKNPFVPTFEASGEWLSLPWGNRFCLMMLSKQKAKFYRAGVTCAGVTRGEHCRRRFGREIAQFLVSFISPSECRDHFPFRILLTERARRRWAKSLLQNFFSRRRCAAKSCPQGRVRIHLRDDPHRRYISHYVLTRARARVCGTKGGKTPLLSLDGIFAETRKRVTHSELTLYVCGVRRKSHSMRWMVSWDYVHVQWI